MSFGVRRLVCPIPWPVNVYLDDDGLLVDSGYPWSAAALLRAGGSVRRIVLTHSHPDHAGSAARLAAAAGAQVFAHPLAVPFLTGAATLAEVPAWWAAGFLHRLLRRLGLLDVRPLRRVHPLAEGERVGRWTVLHTPGHTPCSLSLWDPESGALLLGDCLVNHPWGCGPGVPWLTLDREQRDRSLQRLARLPVRHLLFGHGPPREGSVGDFFRGS